MDKRKFYITVDWKPMICYLTYNKGNHKNGKMVPNSSQTLFVQPLLDTCASKDKNKSLKEPTVYWGNNHNKDTINTRRIPKYGKETKKKKD